MGTLFFALVLLLMMPGLDVGGLVWGGRKLKPSEFRYEMAGFAVLERVGGLFWGGRIISEAFCR